MSVPERVKKRRTEEEEWQLIRMNPSQKEMKQEPELLPWTETPPKKKPGRPEESKKKQAAAEEPAKKKTRAS